MHAETSSVEYSFPAFGGFGTVCPRAAAAAIHFTALGGLSKFHGPKGPIAWPVRGPMIAARAMKPAP